MKWRILTAGYPCAGVRRCAEIVPLALFHGENTGSIPVGRASTFKPVAEGAGAAHMAVSHRSLRPCQAMDASPWTRE